MYSIGKHSYSYAIRRGDANDVIIGKYSCLAENTILDSGFNHNTRYVTSFPLSSIWSELKSNIDIEGKNIIIGNDVWIGESCLIKCNVKIGDGAIIGFGSIITKDVEPYSVIVGENKFVRKRFTEEQIKKLIEIKWWDWEDEKVKQNAHLLLSENIEEFINKNYKP